MLLKTSAVSKGHTVLADVKMHNCVAKMLDNFYFNSIFCKASCSLQAGLQKLMEAGTLHTRLQTQSLLARLFPSSEAGSGRKGTEDRTEGLEVIGAL